MIEEEDDDDNNNNKECSCNDCKSACSHRPGWFKAGEPEKVAAYLGISLEDLFKTKLAVDWWLEGPYENPIFLLAPGIDKIEPGTEYPADPHGVCRFYDTKKERCTIHPVKPFECREYIHGDSEPVYNGRHREAALTWDNEKGQQQVIKMLGKKPRILPPTAEELCNMPMDINTS